MLIVCLSGKIGKQFSTSVESNICANLGQRDRGCLGYASAGSDKSKISSRLNLHWSDHEKQCVRASSTAQGSRGYIYE